MGDDDDIDDLLDDRKADLEARFRELERDAEIERMRGGAPRPEGRAGPPPAEPQRPSAGAGANAEPPAASGAKADPLADLKAAVEGSAPLERYLLVLCPHCDAKNRMSLGKVRTASPVCGRCKRELSFAKY
jgi:hypothetical protein